jgi:hypothetical protein
MTTISPARLRALEVIGAAGQARVARSTSDEDPSDPTISSAAAKWLRDEGYAEEKAVVDGGDVNLELELTEAGLAAYHRRPTSEAPDPAAVVEETFGGGEPDELEEPDAGDDDELEDDDGRIDGELPVEISSKITGALERLTRPMHHREKLVLVLEAKVVGLNFPATDDGVHRVQTLKVLDAFDITGTVGSRMLNELKEAHAPSALPFGEKADAAIVGEALGVTDASGVVLTPGDLTELGLDSSSSPAVVIFSDGARVPWPDDFEKGAARPALGDELVPPGGSEISEGVELIDMRSGRHLGHDDDVPASSSSSEEE